MQILQNVLPAARVEASLDYDALAAQARCVSLHLFSVCYFLEQQADASQADGYSGSDLVLVCKEAAMRPLRRLLATLDINGSYVPADTRPDPVLKASSHSYLHTRARCALCSSAHLSSREQVRLLHPCRRIL